MRWTPGNRDNVEDMRGRSGMVPLGIGGVLVLALLSWATGTNFFTLLGTDTGQPNPGASTSRAVQSSPGEERTMDFVDAVARDVQTTWAQALGTRYRKTTVVVFRDAIQSACGAAESASGPFYCPSDGKVYLDLSFFDELSQRFGAPGDFARAYVIAHEFGHHVQHLLGIGGRAAGTSASGPESASVAIELQADCFAGVWGHAASQQGEFQMGRIELDPGDAQEALRAASAIGDDRLQRMATGRVMPERFTHGTSAQRSEWFARGMDSGDPNRCSTGASTTR